MMLHATEIDEALCLSTQLLQMVGDDHLVQNMFRSSDLAQETLLGGEECAFRSFFFNDSVQNVEAVSTHVSFL